LKGIDRETVAAVLADRSKAAASAAEADGTGRAGADELAAERLLARNRVALLRVADPRTRRGRTYTLLARNGFDPDVCREVSARWLGLEAAED
jgi:hypothetical protein